MPDPERRPPTAESGGGFYLAVGAVVVAALVGAYVLVGTPGLHLPVDKGPVDKGPVVAQEPAPPASPSPR
jgi:hypothetical protein